MDLLAIFHCFPKFHKLSFLIIKKYLHLLTIVFLVYILHVKTLAAPFPGMGTSLLSNSDHFMARKKINLNTLSLDWTLEAAPNHSAQQTQSDISLRYSDKKSNAVLTIRTETLDKKSNLDTYSKKWIRDYTAYGFDILGTRNFTQGNAQGLVIDLIHKGQNKQLRQVIFVKDFTSAIFTCSDDLKVFKKTLNTCNSVLKTFSWLE